MITVGIHNFNIFDHISELIHIIEDYSYITFNNVTIDKMLNNPEYKLIVWDKDLQFIENYLNKESTFDKEIINFNNFKNANNLQIITYDYPPERRLYFMLDHCLENNIDCMITKKMIKNYSKKLINHCKKYVIRLNLIDKCHNEIIIDSSIIMFLLKFNNNIPNNNKNDNIFKFILDKCLENKKIIAHKATIIKCRNFIQDNENIDLLYNLDTFIENIVIVEDVDNFISTEKEKESYITRTNKLIENFPEFKYLNFGNSFKSKDKEFTKSIMISNSLNIPFMTCNASYYNILYKYKKSTILFYARYKLF